MIGERLADFGFIKIMGFPLEVTEKSKRRSIRMLGLILFAPWFYTVGLLGLAISLFGTFVSILEEVWEGE